jgi:glycosyltransferase involved in cell wall biosynthesis
MISYLSEMLSVNPMIKCLLLTQIDEVLGAFMDKFPGRVKCSWVEPKRVAEHLVAADYAILFREPSITNSVSSPTKFAEYLSCGLPVLANNTMAITDLVRNHELGWIVESGGDDLVQKLASVDIQTKNRIRQVALQFFWKKSPVIRAAYQRVLEC